MEKIILSVDFAKFFDKIIYMKIKSLEDPHNLKKHSLKLLENYIKKFYASLFANGTK